MTNLFTYGTLMHPEVWKKIGNENCPRARAMLRHYSVRSLKDLEYPGLVAHVNGQSTGILYFNLNASEIQRLDQFEGSEYKRISVEVFSNNELVAADTYLYVGNQDLIIDYPWRLENFNLQNSFLMRNQ